MNKQSDNRSGFLKTVFAENKEFYPTPDELLEKMFLKMKLHCKEKGLRDYEYGRFHLLEPSAGKGDIVNYYREHIADCYCPKSDVVELDPLLRQYLKGDDHYSVVWDACFTRACRRS